MESANTQLTLNSLKVDEQKFGMPYKASPAYRSLSYYTRHPHYPEVKLNSVRVAMTGTTMSTSNKSTTTANEARWLRDTLSDTNSAIDEA